MTDERAQTDKALDRDGALREFTHAVTRSVEDYDLERADAAARYERRIAAAFEFVAPFVVPPPVPEQTTAVDWRAEATANLAELERTRRAVAAELDRIDLGSVGQGPGFDLRARVGAAVWPNGRPSDVTTVDAAPEPDRVVLEPAVGDLVRLTAPGIDGNPVSDHRWHVESITEGRLHLVSEDDASELHADAATVTVVARPKTGPADASLDSPTP